MEEKVLKFFMEKGFLLDKDMLNFFNQLEDQEVADKILKRMEGTGEKIITKSLIDQNLNKMQDLFSSLEDQKKKIVERFFVNFSVKVEIKKEKYVEEVKEAEKVGEVVNNLNIITPTIIPAKKIVVEDFVKNFKNRYTEIKQILQERTELQNLTPLERIAGQRQNISVIVLVSNKRVTKNKNILLEIEDLTGKGLALINHNKADLFKKAQDLLLDEVIGLKCVGSREMLFVNDIVHPDSAIHEKKRAEKESYALFTSDLHLGSSKFLEENLSRFIDWLNGKINHKEEVKKIKYLFFTGDNVDGVGIFPGQENQLKIKDIKEQYRKLAGFLSQIRKDIRIIMCPGQHDAVRVAEPQPAIGEDYAPDLHKISNLTLVTNPCYVSLEEGFEVLMYHGAGFHGVINDIEALRLVNAHNKPSLVIKELLKRRHLAPTHSSVVYIPGEKDPLFIRRIPDIITTGEMHRSDIDTYNNTLIIANSCWQAQTPYEEKVGNNPDPCKVPMLNLKTREIKILDFS
jgi:DNA polymerase II small subunit